MGLLYLFIPERSPEASGISHYPTLAAYHLYNYRHNVGARSLKCANVLDMEMRGNGRCSTVGMPCIRLLSTT